MIISMPRPDLPPLAIIDHLADQSHIGVSKAELAAVRAEIGRIIAGKTLGEVNVADVRRGQAEQHHAALRKQAEEASTWLTRLLGTTYAGIRDIPNFPDEIFRRGDSIPIGSHWDWKAAVNLQLVTARYDNGDFPLGGANEEGNRWGTSAVEFGGVSTILGFTDDKRNALLEYTSPLEEGAITGNSSPNGMQYFEHVTALSRIRSEFLAKRDFHRELRAAITAMTSGTAARTAVSVRGREVGVGDYVHVRPNVDDLEVCAMNLDPVTQYNKEKAYDVFEVNPSPDGVITPDSIHIEGEHEVWKSSSIAFRDLAEWDTVWLGSDCMALIRGFTDDGRFALVEFRGSDAYRRGLSISDTEKIHNGLIGLQFFVPVGEEDHWGMKSLPEEWKRMTQKETARGVRWKISPLDMSNIYDWRDVDRNLRPDAEKQE